LAPLRWINAQATWLNSQFPDDLDCALIVKMCTDLCCNGGDPAEHIVHDALPNMPEKDGNKKVRARR
jgi:hypothetical protein